MAGVDTEHNGEARPMPGLNIGYLPQEPELDYAKNVREIVEEALGEVKKAQEAKKGESGRYRTYM